MSTVVQNLQNSASIIKCIFSSYASRSTYVSKREKIGGEGDSVSGIKDGPGLKIDVVLCCVEILILYLAVSHIKKYLGVKATFLK